MGKATPKGTATERALARMLGAVRPNGPVHMPDWLNEPEISVEGTLSTLDEKASEAHGVEVSATTIARVELNTFHYLRARLSVNTILTASLQRFGYRDGGSWGANIQDWAKAQHTGDGAEWWPFGTFATSGHYGAQLSDDIEGAAFTHQSGLPMVALRREDGGTGRPYVFEVTSDEPHDFFDWGKWGFGHHPAVTTGHELPDMPLPPGAWSDSDGIWHVTHAWDRESNEGEGNGWVESGGSFVRLSDYAAHGHLGDHDELVWEQHGEGAVWLPRCPLDGELCDVWPASTW